MGAAHVTDAMGRLAWVALLSLAACGSAAQTPAPNGGAPGATSGAGGGSSSDAGGPTASGSAAADGGAVSGDGGEASSLGDAAGGCASAAGCGSLSGLVERTSTTPTHGGKGPVYVAVFDGNPITNVAQAVVVARSLLPSVDLSASDASVAYRVDGIPVSAQAYQVIAFLDDANAVTAANPTPASGDLISLVISGGNVSGVPATISATGTTTLDLPLNAAMP